MSDVPSIPIQPVDPTAAARAPEQTQPAGVPATAASPASTSAAEPPNPARVTGWVDASERSALLADPPGARAATPTLYSGYQTSTSAPSSRTKARQPSAESAYSRDIAGIDRRMVLVCLYAFASMLASYFLTIVANLVLIQALKPAYNGGVAFFIMGFVLVLLTQPLVLVASTMHSGQMACHPGSYSWIMWARLFAWLAYFVAVTNGGIFLFSTASSGCAYVANCEEGRYAGELVKYVILSGVGSTLTIWDACFTARYRGAPLHVE